MPEPKTVRIRDEIKEMAQEMERRMRESAKKIASGDWRHYRLMSEADLMEGAERNLAHLQNTLSPEKALEAAADAANFANFLRLRQAEAAQQKGEE